MKLKIFVIISLFIGAKSYSQNKIKIYREKDEQYLCILFDSLGTPLDSHYFFENKPILYNNSLYWGAIRSNEGLIYNTVIVYEFSTEKYLRVKRSKGFSLNHHFNGDTCSGFFFITNIKTKKNQSIVVKYGTTHRKKKFRLFINEYNFSHFDSILCNEFKKNFGTFDYCYECN